MPFRVCFIGDSFVNGTGDDGCLGWAGRACAAMVLGYSLIAAAFGAWAAWQAWADFTPS